MTSIRVLISESHDPYFNLAVEETIFQAMPAEQWVLFLWRNADTVVIGRGQNPWKECNTARMDSDCVKLARRQTGGGAVFHDLGNTNFTFMAGKPEFDKSITTQIVLDGLSELGIQGVATGRNDLVVQTPEGEKKFSGSAYRDASDRGFHHGTLLLDADLTRLANYLNPDPKKLQAKGIASVISRVVNLSELNADVDHESVSLAIQNRFFERFGEQVEPELISSKAMPELPGFEMAFQRQSDWDWNFGKSMEFTHHLDERFEWGGVEIQLDVQAGRIRNAMIFTDSLYPAMLEELADTLVGKRYLPELANEVDLLLTKFPDHGNELTELKQWFAHAVN